MSSRCRWSRSRWLQTGPRCMRRTGRKSRCARHGAARNNETPSPPSDGEERRGRGKVFTMLVAFHKPYGVISQFTSDGSDFRTLAEFGFPPRFYPIGRLDADSEGLLLLRDEA